jgi:hypothetical protein
MLDTVVPIVMGVADLTGCAGTVALCSTPIEERELQLVLKTLAWLNLAFGLTLAVATPFVDTLSVPMFALGALLVAQGTYVIAYSTRVFAPFEPFAETGLIIGSTLLGAIGLAAFFQQMVFLLNNPVNPEYAPLTGAVLSTILAVVTLWQYAKH